MSIEKDSLIMLIYKLVWNQIIFAELFMCLGFKLLTIIHIRAGVIGSDIPWLDCPASNAITWVITE